ncbi:right-handed parallel beta-helix repeat-containing protein [Winogradskyella vincentii]|uniref:Right handed beta helix region n=1 Tax=Winogradskyella vincentii TaxID=2877122 RepID=A0ABS7Y4L8_9FLAO|nr:hypothetical protein [Winogradskyella vincentii]MCA0153587.1 hypothetical protein [Winogradskyella vincentii]
MKTLTFFRKVFLFCSLGLFLTNIEAQTIITIDNNANSTTTYTTIQAAHDAATAGDIIYVQPSGTNYGTVNISKEITIVGRSHSEPGKVSELSTVSIRSSNVTIKGVKFGSLNYSNTGTPQAPPYVGTKIYECEFSSATYGPFSGVNFVDDVEVRGCVITGTQTIYSTASNLLFSNNIFANTGINSYVTLTLVVANNIFRGTTSVTITNNDPADGTFILFNNMFTGNSGSNIFVNLNTGPFNLSNNLTYNFGFGNLDYQSNATGSFTETGSLNNTNPLFTDVDNTVSQSFAGTSTYNSAFRPEDNLTLQAGSPALTGGGGGSEIGLYNNGFNFSKLGVPRGLPTLDVISYDGAVPKNGNINVTVTAKAN